MRGIRIWPAAALAAMAALPAQADVKAGADAWSRGDYAGAVAQWQEPARSGDPDAEFNLGQAYRLGRGVPRDLGRAEELFGKAAAQGHVQAADNYGLLMFDRGARAQAMPYVKAASDRGDPRAQYLMAIAHFNGDLAAKDWVRAYALMTLARSAGLPQAAPAIQQMDSFIPLAERQQGASVAPQLAQQAETTRNTQIASNDLGEAPAAAKPVAAAAAPPVAVPEPGGAATAGADYARPAGAQAPPLPVPGAKPAPVRPAVAAAPAKLAATGAPALKPVPAKPAAAVALAPKPRPAAAVTGGIWRVQLGAFGVAANADALWARASARPELAGHRRIDVPTGKVSKLQAGGFASPGAAASACAGLTRAGFTCLVTQD